MWRAVVRSVWVRLRRDVRALLTVTLMLFFAAPLFLGPATAVLLHALGGEVEHACACGMKRGTCGCPECAQLEKERRESKKPVPYMTLKSSCDDDEDGRGVGALPPAVPSVPFVVHQVVYTERATPLLPRALVSIDPDEPATPPPRLLSV